MPYNITHSFVSTKPDRAADILAGKVTPSNWNNSHTITGSIGANEVTNIPAGSVTAVNVQAAINQLAGLIPAVGPGTDPLALTHGLSVSTINPTFSGNDHDRYAVRFQLNTDVSNVAPDFADSNVLEVIQNVLMGQATYGPVTQVKETFLGNNTSMTCWGSGQKFCNNNLMVSYSMSDSAVWGGNTNFYCGGPIAGDEGQGWQMVSRLSQFNRLMQATITAVPAKSLVNTTTTQAITRDWNPQTVTVVNMAGAINGDWVVVDQEIHTGFQNVEAVQIISFTANSITAIFRCNHLNGATITPATLIQVNNPSEMGQDRILVNMSQPSYSAGTVTAVNVPLGPDFTFTGAATAWADNMVGGYALNIGAIALTADDLPDTPFNALNPLKSWYTIRRVVDPTTLIIHSFDVAGNAAYRGKGPGAGAYTIRPCAQILRPAPTGGTLVCETSTSTWSVGDTVDCIICPYPDVEGFQYHLEAFTNGGSYRCFMNVANLGARTFSSALFFPDRGFVVPASWDAQCWDHVIDMHASCLYGIHIDSNCISGAINLSSDLGGIFTDRGGYIVWGTGTAPYVGFDTPNQALRLETTLNTDIKGRLQFNMQGFGDNFSALQPGMSFGGYFYLPRVSTDRGFIYVDNVTDPINFERAFLRWDSTNIFQIGTLKGGGGTARDFMLMTDNTERVRLDALGNVVMGNAAIATTATDGFLYAVSGAGQPTGVPTAYAGRIPIYVDTTNSQLWMYLGGVWKQPKTPAGAAIVTWQ